MSDNRIRFDDGAAYERMMGVWSRLAGEIFLDWLSPPPGQRWIDIGCGNGAFTELIDRRCDPIEIFGVDPSEGQLRYARTRLTSGRISFEQGDAMALPCDDQRFDVAVMALVIFFVPDPAKGVAQMTRVVKPGGAVCAYAWDILEPGGFPLAAMQEELRISGVTPMMPPSPEASRLPALRALWADARLTDIATRTITVARTFEDFEDFWASVQIAAGMAQATSGIGEAGETRLKDALRARLPGDAAGRISFTSRANAVTGRVPRLRTC